MKSLIIITLTIIISSCATMNTGYAPTELDLAKADYGSKPTNYKKVIKEHIADNLIDPESARFTKFSKPQKSWMSEFQGFKNFKYYGWLVCVDVNAKNSFGGYTGKKTYVALLRGDKVVYYQQGIQRQIAYGMWKHFAECEY